MTRPHDLCSEIQALFSGAYDDEFGPGDRERFYSHLNHCPECAKEFALYQKALLALRALEPAPAAAGLEQRVLAELTRDAGHSTVVSLATEPQPTRPISTSRLRAQGRRPAGVSKPLAAAAALLLATAAALVTRQIPALFPPPPAAPETVPPGHVRIGARTVPADTLVAELLEAQGYVRSDGRWVPREEAARTAEGRVFYAGRWLTPAEIKETLFREAGLVRGKAGWEVAGAAPAPPPVADVPAPAAPERRLPLDETLAALGYEKIGDRWISAQEKGFLEKGLVFYGDRWLSPAELKRDLLELEGLVYHTGRWMTREQRDMLLAAAVVDRRPDAPAQNELTAVLESLAIGEPVSQDALTVYPLYARAPLADVPVAFLETALRGGKFEVRDDAKNPRRLRARNANEHPVLLLAGELLAGGTQDRLMARDTVVPPAKKWIDLEVYCAEPGRSAGRVDRFEAAGAVAAPGLRQILLADAAQADVWSRIRRDLNAAEAKSPTDALRAVYARPAFRERLESLVRRLGDLPARDGRTVGVAIGQEGDLEAAEIFASNAALRDAFPKLLAAAAAHATARPPAAAVVAPPARLANTKAGVKQLLEGAFYCDYARQKTAENGDDLVLRARDAVVGRAILHEGRLCHAVIYPGAPVPPEAGPPVTYTLDPEKAKRMAAEFTRAMAAAGDPERVRAVREFSALKWDRVADTLAPYVAVENSDAVRIALAEGLGATRSPQAVKPLIDLLDKPRRRPLVAKAAADALARTGDPRAADPLFKLLHQPDAETARIGLDACALLLAALRDGPAIEKAMSRFIAFHEMLDPHAYPGHVAQGCVAHRLFEALYEPMRFAMLGLTEYHYKSGAEYRLWWNRNKEAWLRARAG